MNFFPNGLLDALVLALLIIKVYSCPEDLIREVFSCLHNLTHDSDLSQLIAVGDADKMRKHCRRSGDFTDSVHCLERINRECVSPKSRELVEKIADPVAWSSGFKYFCDRIDVYSNKKVCMKKQNDLVTDCVRRNDEVFENNVDNPGTQYDSIPLEIRRDKLLEHICRFFHFTNYCLTSVIVPGCGEDMEGLLGNFIGGIRPPVCRDYKINTGTKIKSNSVGILLTFLILIYCALTYL